MLSFSEGSRMQINVRRRFTEKFNDRNRGSHGDSAGKASVGVWRL